MLLKHMILRKKTCLLLLALSMCISLFPQQGTIVVPHNLFMIYLIENVTALQIEELCEVYTWCELAPKRNLALIHSSAEYGIQWLFSVNQEIVEEEFGCPFYILENNHYGANPMHPFRSLLMEENIVMSAGPPDVRYFGEVTVHFEVGVAEEQINDFCDSYAWCALSVKDGLFWIPFGGGRYWCVMSFDEDVVMSMFGDCYALLLALNAESIVNGANFVLIYHNDISDDTNISVTYQLHGNYPNPFNPSTTIDFDMALNGHVSIEIYNIKGQRVKEVASGNYSAGRHSVVWNGDDTAGRSVGSGVYFYRMTTDGYSSVRKMLLMK